MGGVAHPAKLLDLLCPKVMLAQPRVLMFFEEAEVIGRLYEAVAVNHLHEQQVCQEVNACERTSTTSLVAGAQGGDVTWLGWHNTAVAESCPYLSKGLWFVLQPFRRLAEWQVIILIGLTASRSRF